MNTKVLKREHIFQHGAEGLEDQQPEHQMCFDAMAHKVFLQILVLQVEGFRAYKVVGFI